MIKLQGDNHIFRNFAANYAENGLVVFPVGGASGKQPLVKNWRKFKLNTYENLSEKFDSANIGILNDNLTIVDIDDPRLISEVIERFGDTPIKVETPSGGAHFWYKSSGETRKISLDNQKIDILGNGGFAVAPPSINPSRGRYRFIEGAVNDLCDLPPLKAGSLPDKRSLDRAEFRNNTLFSACLSFARDASTEEELLLRALEVNKGFDVPLAVDEVQAVSASAWKYEVRGKNMFGRNVMVIEQSMFEQLKFDKNALILLAFLENKHKGIRNTFCIDQEEVAPLIGVKSRPTVKKAIERLVLEKKIKPVGKKRKAIVYEGFF